MLPIHFFRISPQNSFCHQRGGKCSYLIVYLIAYTLYLYFIPLIAYLTLFFRVLWCLLSTDMCFVDKQADLLISLQDQISLCNNICFEGDFSFFLCVC